MDDRGFILDSDAAAQDVYSVLHDIEIRTLLLAPGKKGTPIVCEMQVVPSPSDIQFEALSYVWGDVNQSQLITCNGFDFAVTRSLHNALDHMRYPDSWRRLWVDQLCINQRDSLELIKQVGMMGTIYSSACRVVVWLGNYDKKMAFAFELVQETSLSSSLVRSDFLQTSSGPSTPRRRSLTPRRKSLTPRNTPRHGGLSRHSSRASSSRESLPSLSTSTSSLSSFSSSSSRPPNRRQDTPPALKHALSIFQHVYFSRKWTFQEIILAKAAIICCGELEMAWSDLSLWYFHYVSKLRSSSLLYDSDGSFENILKVRNELDRGTLTLSNLLMLTRARMTTKPEDHIYGILGLFPPDLIPSLKRTFEATAATQEETLFKLYLEVFQHCIDKEQDLTILSAAGRYKGNGQAQNWPAWLPDWRLRLPLRPLVLSNPTDLGPESAFDEETFGSQFPRVQQDIQRDNSPLYKLLFDPSMLPLSSRRFSMIVTGIRLGCIVTRPLSWPGTFLVADSFAQSLSSDSASAVSGDKYSQPLSSLATSFTALVQQSQTTQISMVELGYSATLIQSSLKAGSRCSSVRTSAMVETGDWLCAFRGGKVLYALRPLDEAPDEDPGQLLGESISPKGRFAGRVSRSSTTTTFSSTTKAFKAIYIGECAVHGFRPAELLDSAIDTMQFELR